MFWPILCEKSGALSLATLSATVEGCIWPIYGLLTSIGIYKLSDNNEADEIRDEGIFLVWIFLIVAVVSAISNFGVGNLFNLIGEHLARRVRIICYEKYLSFHMGFYDYSENSPGSLLTKLASDSTKLNGLAMSMFSVAVEQGVTLVLALILALIFCWEVALLVLAFIPFLIAAGALSIKYENSIEQTDEIKEKDLGNILSECVLNTKTLYCFNMQEKAVNMYKSKMKQTSETMGSYIWAALLNGFAQMLVFSTYALAFYVGAVLVDDENKDYEFDDILKAIFSLIFAAYGLGAAVSYLGDLEDAKKALISIHTIVSTPSEINPFLEEGTHNSSKEGKDYDNVINSKTDKKDTVLAVSNVAPLTKANTEDFIPRIEFRNVYFSYPTRPNTKIFKGLSFIIEAGEQAAFVGFSGSGKSTIIQLLLRFYDIQNGEILINNINIKDYDLISLRQQMGLVMQEPVLLKTNVYNNIKYGDLSASSEKVLNCAKLALVPRIEQISPNNTESLPVSGGEKQRIAIARCLLRNPKILLLDEATSALDENVEAEVQKSLDSLMEGRTSVVIAHKLSTIVNSNKIFFLEHGEIKEVGTHDSLMKMEGKYHSLYEAGQKKKAK